MAKRVLVQAGHNPPREPGFESGTGTAGEIEFVKGVADRLLALLRRDSRFQGIYSPGDIPNGIKVDAALFLHADGAGSPTASGYSFGFPPFNVNSRLARLIGQEFAKIPGHPPHHADNYTAAMRGYYGFSRVDTPGPEVLVEHGFLTNPGERKWLLGHKDELALAEYRALCAFFGFEPKGEEEPKDIGTGFVWYAEAGEPGTEGYERVRSDSLLGLAQKLVDDDEARTRLRKAIVATEEDTGTIGFRAEATP